MSGPASSSSSQTLRNTSRYLFARVRLGDASALNLLVSRYLPRLRRWAHGRLARWARSGIGTSDLLQDAVLRSLPKISTFDPRGERALGAFLEKVVQNRIRDEYRKVGRKPIPRGLSDTMIDPRPSPLDRVLSAEQEHRYRAALAVLSPGDRELIVAHLELDYTHEQLAIMTNRSTNAARMALQRATRRLVERMRDV